MNPTGRFPSKRSWILFMALSTFGALMTWSPSSNAQDDVVEEEAAPRPAEKGPAEMLFDRSLFGEGKAIEAARSRLETTLRKKIDSVDRTCGLGEVQKKKLQLAGRGDLKRFFEQAEALRAKAKTVGFDETRMRDLQQELEPLQ